MKLHWWWSLTSWENRHVCLRWTICIVNPKQNQCKSVQTNNYLKKYTLNVIEICSENRKNTVRRKILVSWNVGTPNGSAFATVPEVSQRWSPARPFGACPDGASAKWKNRSQKNRKKQENRGSVFARHCQEARSARRGHERIYAKIYRDGFGLRCFCAAKTRLFCENFSKSLRFLKIETLPFCTIFSQHTRQGSIPRLRRSETQMR